MKHPKKTTPSPVTLLVLTLSLKSPLTPFLHIQDSSTIIDIPIGPNTLEHAYSILEKIEQEASAILDLIAKLCYIINFQNSEVLANRPKN